jgi:hypothetical protein
LGHHSTPPSCRSGHHSTPPSCRSGHHSLDSCPQHLSPSGTGRVPHPLHLRCWCAYSGHLLLPGGTHLESNGPVCLESGVSRWLVGVVGLGVELHQRPQAARGALLRFECLSKTRGAPQAFAREGYARGVWVSSPVPGRARGNKAAAFHNPQAFSNVQEENRSCARDQVVVARPPVLTPPTTLSALSCE